MTDEPIIPERSEPEGNGYRRMTISEFEAYNTQATEYIQQVVGDGSVTSYTYALPDQDPNYVWVREEGVYTQHLPEEDKANIKTREEAVAISMKIPVEDDR